MCLYQHKIFTSFLHIIIWNFQHRFCLLRLKYESWASDDEFLLIMKIIFYFSSTICSSVKLTNQTTICTAFENNCFFVIFFSKVHQYTRYFCELMTRVLFFFFMKSNIQIWHFLSQCRSSGWRGFSVWCFLV